MQKIFLLFLLVAVTVKAQSPDDIYTVTDSVSIPVSGGKTISATIVRKKVNIMPLPVILFYTTYYQGPNDAVFAKKSADRDYVGIVAYARGIRGNSTDYAPYEHEATDIYDIIDWISKQPWCNGKVGMYGGSYTGFAQWAATKKLHPALKTIVPQVAVMPGYDVPMENNVPTTNILHWPNDNVYKFPPLSRDLVFRYFDSGIAFRKLDSLSGYPNAVFQKWLNHPAYDKYWQSMVPTPEEYAKVNIPVLTTTGYYDGSQLSALQYLKLHNQYNKNANHYFVIGPYDHWGAQRKPVANLMGYAIDPVAQVNMQELAYEWLGYILKNDKKPALLKDRINYEVMGSNEWKHAPSLKKMNNHVLKLYLDNTVLSDKKPAKKSALTQVVDFKDRENQNNNYTPDIIFDTLDLGNGLLFKSNPFDQEFAVNGSFEGKLLVTTNKKDMDISIMLYEQMPDGKYFFLTRYIGRASYAANPSKRQLLQPGHKETITFHNTRLVSKKISKGSRLVILLNVNKHPFEIINYGSGKEPADETIKDAGAPLHMEWHNKSYISIPIWKND